MAHALSLSVFIAFKRTNCSILFAFTVCRSAALKSLPYIINSADHILLLGLWDQWEYFENLNVRFMPKTI